MDHHKNISHIFNANILKEECKNEEDCDGIQCTKNLEGTPFPKTRPSTAREHVEGAFLQSRIIAQDPAKTGVPCVWLKKPKQTQSCKFDSQFLTCWKEEPEERKYQH